MKKVLLHTVGLVVVLLSMVVAMQAGTLTTFYDVTLSNTGPTGNDVWRMTSATSGTDPYAYLRYEPGTPFALNTLSVLSADFNMVTGPFVGGSPRFDIGLDFNNDGVFDWTNDRLIWAYWGSQPWGSGTPPTGWTNTGNFMNGSSLWGPITFWDGNTQYSLAQFLAAYGNLNVMRVYVSLDSGWAGNTQILDVDNFTINGDINSPTSVPEPSFVLLLAMGFGSVGLIARRFKS